VPVTFVGNHDLRDAIEPGVVHDAGVVAVDHLAEEKRVGMDSSDPGRELAKERAWDRVATSNRHPSPPRSSQWRATCVAQARTSGFSWSSAGRPSWPSHVRPENQSGRWKGAPGVIEDAVEEDAHVARVALDNEMVEVGIGPEARVEPQRVHSVVTVVR